MTKRLTFWIGHATVIFNAMLSLLDAHYSIFLSVGNHLLFVSTVYMGLVGAALMAYSFIQELRYRKRIKKLEKDFLK